MLLSDENIIIGDLQQNNRGILQKIIVSYLSEKSKIRNAE
jgi:hypothetical protein